jgi:TolA-binding protein
VEATPPPPPPPQDPIDGLRAWVAQLDRSLGVRTYLLGAISVLGLAAGVVAVVLVLQLKQDAATKDDVDALSTQLSTVQDAAAQAAEDKVKSLDDRISALETKVDGLSGDQSNLQRELDSLKQEVSPGTTGGGKHGSGSSTGIGGAFPGTGTGSAIPGTSGSGTGAGTGSSGGSGGTGTGGTSPGG